MTNEKAIQKTLEKTVKLFDLAAGADKLYRLGFSNALFVPVNIDADDENAIFTYHLDELSPVSSIQNFTICEKLRMLLNISGLFGISDEYSFSLEPDNVYIDRNLEPKILFRDLNSEDNRHDFISVCLCAQLQAAGIRGGGFNVNAGACFIYGDAFRRAAAGCRCVCGDMDASGL